MSCVAPHLPAWEDSRDSDCLSFVPPAPLGMFSPFVFHIHSGLVNSKHKLVQPGNAPVIIKNQVFPYNYKVLDFFFLVAQYLPLLYSKKRRLAPDAPHPRPQGGALRKDPKCWRRTAIPQEPVLRPRVAGPGWRANGWGPGS